MAATVNFTAGYPVAEREREEGREAGDPADAAIRHALVTYVALRSNDEVILNIK